MAALVTRLEQIAGVAEQPLQPSGALPTATQTRDLELLIARLEAVADIPKCTTPESAAAGPALSDASTVAESAGGYSKELASGTSLRPLPASRELWGRLSPIARIGVCGYGVVKLVSDRESGANLALKCFSKHAVHHQDELDFVLREKAALQLLTARPHPAVVRLHDTYHDESSLYLMLESVAGGSLRDLLEENMWTRSLPEPTARFVIAQAVAIMEHVHGCGIAYRDLKPENLLHDEHGYLKLVDMGFAIELRPNQRTYTHCGTPEYIAPEILTRGECHV